MSKGVSDWVWVSNRLVEKEGMPLNWSWNRGVLMWGGVLWGLLSSMIFSREGEVVSLVRSTSYLSVAVNFDVMLDHVFFVKLTTNVTFFFTMGGSVYWDWLASPCYGPTSIFPLNSLVILSLVASRVTTYSLAKARVLWICFHFLACFLVWVGRLAFQIAWAISSTLAFTWGSLKYICYMVLANYSKSSSIS